MIESSNPGVLLYLLFEKGKNDDKMAGDGPLIKKTLLDILVGIAN